MFSCDTQWVSEGKKIIASALRILKRLPVPVLNYFRIREPRVVP
jgi:hypothetical protein